MEDLIKRIEAADGPDRGLDAEICEAMGFTVVGHYRRGSNEPIRGYSWQPVPRYTSSIDAAMTLVPEGWRLQLSEWDHEDLRAKGPWQAILERNGTRGDFMEPAPRCDHAKTPALALCAAALRAKTAQNEG